MELVFASMADVYALLVTVAYLVIAVNESISRRRVASMIALVAGCAAAVYACVWTAGRDLIARYQHHAQTSVRHMVFA